MTGDVNIQEAVSPELASNRSRLEDLFADCHDIVMEYWTSSGGTDASVLTVYCRSLISSDKVHEIRSMIEAVTSEKGEQAHALLSEWNRDRHGHGHGIQQTIAMPDTLQRSIELILQGYVVSFVAGWSQTIAYKMESFDRRQITEPVSEPVVKGPREGTVENLDINVGMLRQRIRTPGLKVHYVHAGETTKTTIAYCYLDQVISSEVLEEFRGRLKGIDAYNVPETSYVEGWIEDSVWSPFPQYRYTERTDVIAAAIMDGKIAVLVDNTPMVMVAPAQFVDFIGTGEDYYVRTVYATMIRFLRLLAFTIALTLPSIYIALSTFHSEMIPTVLLLAILDTREGIPFPAFVEALIMEVSFELLREAGIRLPRPVGSAVSIVGALVIGQAAIMAKIASPIMVIVVAFTGIASFAIPHYEFAIAIRILRFPLMVAAALLGGFGMMLVCLMILLHMICLHTLGQPYLSSITPLKLRDFRDIVVRAPLKQFMMFPRNRRLNGVSMYTRKGGNPK